MTRPLAPTALRGRSRSVADYDDRSGFSKPAAGMRGAARGIAVPKDMRVPDAVRGDLFERKRLAAGGRPA